MKKFLIFASFYVFFSIFFGCERVDVSMLDDHSAPMEVHESVDVEIAFEQNVLPILTARCALSGCHIANGPHGLDFRTYESFLAGGEHGPVFLPGNAEESEIVKIIVEGKMPPHLVIRYLMPNFKSSLIGLTNRSIKIMLEVSSRKTTFIR